MALHLKACSAITLAPETGVLYFIWVNDEGEGVSILLTEETTVIGKIGNFDRQEGLDFLKENFSES